MEPTHIIYYFLAHFIFKNGYPLPAIKIKRKKQFIDLYKSLTGTKSMSRVLQTELFNALNTGNYLYKKRGDGLVNKKPSIAHYKINTQYYYEDGYEMFLNKSHQ